jgi:methylglutaconyl-CoA hydratase
MIEELGFAFAALGAATDVRVIVLAGAGTTFSAGADLHWMRAAAELTEEENVADALRLADMLAAIRDCPRPVVARVQGAAMGGGVGLMAAADVAVAGAGTRFAFSEVRLGLVPAVIAPFAVAKIGQARARELFLTGEIFGADRAAAIGLVSRVVAEEDLDAAVEEVVQALLLGAPGAQSAVKGLLDAFDGDRAGLRERTARTIARQRASAEGREGMSAFLDGRPPAWRGDAP